MEKAMKRTMIAAIFALLPLFTASCGLDGGSDDVMEQDTPAGVDLPDEEIGPVACTEGESLSLIKVRIADDLDNATLADDCGAGNPGADIDAIVLVHPDGTEAYAATVEEDSDVAGAVCETNDKDDINTVLGEPDGCAKDLGCGCGDHGYPTNPECDCAGGDSKWVGYYSLNGGAIIVTFEGDEELLCGDQIAVYEMYNPEVAGSEETYEIAYGDTAGNFMGQTDYSTGTGIIDVTWEW
jgi:hypothetical protein